MMDEIIENLPTVCPKKVTSTSVVLAAALRIALTTPVGLLIKTFLDNYLTFRPFISPECKRTFGIDWDSSGREVFCSISS